VSESHVILSLIVDRSWGEFITRVAWLL